MTGVILVLVEYPDVALHTLTVAHKLADLMGATRVNVVAVRVPPETTILPSEEILTAQRAAHIRGRELDRIAALRGVFESWVPTARGGGVAAIEWIDIEGLVDAVVGEWGRRSDVIVLNRRSQRDGVPERLVMQAALFDTDRPVLVAPPALVAGLGERVAIAWRDDRRAVKSVLAALRLISRAAEVHVLAGVRDGTPPPQMPAILAEHGIAATLHALPIGPQAFGETLLAKATELRADMLVMGAYTHSPWRELILGGVTRHLLAHAEIPLFMRH